MRGMGWAVALVLVCSVAACGGGNKSTASSTSPGTGTTSSSVAHIEIVAPNTVDTATDSSITLTATVKDAGNSVLEGQTVAFSADSGSLQVLTATTNSAGEATAKLSVGGNKTNRSISVTAKSGSITANKAIQATGNSLAMTGASINLQQGATTTITVVLKDSGGTPIAGSTATIASSLGNTLSATSASLDYAGTASFTYTATNSGNDTITVNAGGVAQSLTITVSAGADFLAVSPVSNTVVAINTSQIVRFRYSGTTASSRPIVFTTTRGMLSAASTTTDGAGEAIVTVTSVNAGIGTVTATVTLPDSSTKSVSLPLLFSGVTPSTVTVQASPTALAPNASGANQNQSTIEALIRDAANNPVADYTVNFSISAGAGSTLSSAAAKTDADGKARIQFISGSSSSAANGITVTATTADLGSGSVSGSVNLTINSTALFISIFRGELMTIYDTQTYQVPFTLSVVDANGVAVANKAIDLSVWPVSYGKGVLNWDATASLWLRSLSVSCANEDSNRNGTLDIGEDANANTRLEPGLPINLPVSQVTTDAAGLGSFVVRYGKNNARWIYAALTARGSVAGTESSTTYSDWLPVSVLDIADQSTPPPSVISPFGTAALCSNPN